MKLLVVFGVAAVVTIVAGFGFRALLDPRTDGKSDRYEESLF